MNNRQLNSIISEEINRYALRQQVRKIVSEEVRRYIKNYVNEDKEKKEKSKGSKVTDSMRAEVNAWLNSADFVLDSQVSYALWGGADDDDAGAASRSKFAKKKSGKRPWTDQEVLKLYQIKNSMST